MGQKMWPGFRVAKLKRDAGHTALKIDVLEPGESWEISIVNEVELNIEYSRVCYFFVVYCHKYKLSEILVLSTLEVAMIFLCRDFYLFYSFLVLGLIQSCDF